MLDREQGDFSTELIAIEEGTAEVRPATVSVIGDARPRRSDRRDRTAPARAAHRRCRRHLADALIKLTHWEIRRMSAADARPDRGAVHARSVMHRVRCSRVRRRSPRSRAETFDVVVIGGGITGRRASRSTRPRADTASRSCERADYASGTSQPLLQARPRRPALPAELRSRPRPRGAARTSADGQARARTSCAR